MDKETQNTTILPAIIIAASIMGGALIVSDSIRNKKSWFQDCMDYGTKKLDYTGDYTFVLCNPTP